MIDILLEWRAFHLLHIFSLVFTAAYCKTCNTVDEDDEYNKDNQDNQDNQDNDEEVRSREDDNDVYIWRSLRVAKVI